MRIPACLIAVALIAPAAAQAPQLTSAQFVARAEPRMKKSMVSLMFSSEAKKLMGELGAAAQATRARQDADRAAGRKPATCLPPKGKAKVDARELIAHLKALPPAEQQQSFRSGFAGFAARKFPCPKG